MMMQTVMFTASLKLWDLDNDFLFQESEVLEQKTRKLSALNPSDPKRCNASKRFIAQKDDNETMNGMYTHKQQSAMSRNVQKKTHLEHTVFAVRCHKHRTNLLAHVPPSLVGTALSTYSQRVKKTESEEVK